MLPLLKRRCLTASRSLSERILVALPHGYVWDNERSSWKRKEDGKLLRRERRIILRSYPAARFCLIGVYSARHEETIRRTQ
jgi:hypothetical protein